MQHRPAPAERLDATTARTLYDEWAQSYDREMLAWGYVAHEVAARSLRTAGGYGTGSRVLDLACGTGLSGAALLQEGIGTSGGVIGVDISQKCLDVADAKYVYGETILHNLEERLQFANESFDAVLCICAHSYIEDFEAHLGEMARVAKPGALIVFTHDAQAWEADERGCASAAAALEQVSCWKRVRCDAPAPLTPHMPASEDPDGAARSYHLVVYRRLEEKVDREARANKAIQEMALKREANIASIHRARAERERAAEEEAKRLQWEQSVLKYQTRRLRDSGE